MAYLTYIISVCVIEILFKVLERVLIELDFHLLFNLCLGCQKIDCVAAIRQEYLAEDVLKDLTGTLTV